MFALIAMRGLAIAFGLLVADFAGAGEPQGSAEDANPIACDHGVAVACPQLAVRSRAAGELRCDFALDGGDGTAELMLRKARVDGVRVSTLFPGSTSTCSCTLLAERGAEGSHWMDGPGGRVTIRFDGAPDSDDVVVVSRERAGFRVDLRRTSLGRWCGACADLPGRLLVVPDSASCAVELR